MLLPLLTEEALPQPGTTCERSDVDFKVSVSPKATIEMAKDVAALANTVGGVIIVGAQTRGPLVVGYPGIAPAIATQLSESYDQSASQRCRPAPKVVTQIIEREKTDPIVVVNVWPSALAPVGVRIDRQEAWVFPFRVGSHTSFMQPDQFGILENVSARRAAALLLAIPENERQQIRIRWMRPTGRESNAQYSKHEELGRLVEVLPDQNVASFLMSGPPGAAPSGYHELRLPLDWIDTVWREEPVKAWIVFSSAFLDREGDRYVALKLTS